MGRGSYAFLAEAAECGGEDCNGGIVSISNGQVLVIEAFGGLRPKHGTRHEQMDPAYLAAFLFRGACAVSLSLKRVRGSLVLVS